eukprot:7122193-Lingulodinium_polyedra.AAC.1
MASLWPLSALQRHPLPFPWPRGTPWSCGRMRAAQALPLPGSSCTTTRPDMPHQRPPAQRVERPEGGAQAGGAL